MIGVAFAAVRGSNHCGAMDAYTLMAADAGMIGLAGTNALPTMAPWGGAEKIVGINPLSVALPAKTVPAFVPRLRLRRDRARQDPRLPPEGQPDPGGLGVGRATAGRRPTRAPHWRG